MPDMRKDHEADEYRQARVFACLERATEDTVKCGEIQQEETVKRPMLNDSLDSPHGQTRRNQQGRIVYRGGGNGCDFESFYRRLAGQKGKHTNGTLQEIRGMITDRKR